MAATVSADLSPSDFYSSDLRTIYQAILNLCADQKPIDIISIYHECKGAGNITISLISDLDDCGLNENVEYYIDSIQKHARARRVIQDCYRWAETLAKDPTTDIAPQIVDAMSDMATTTQKGVQSFRDMMSEHDAWLNEGTKEACLTTLIDPLDDLIHCQEDYLWVIGARPKTGKTTFVIDLFARFAMSGQGTGLFFSLEMAAERIMRKFHTRIIPHKDYIQRKIDSKVHPVTMQDLLLEYRERLYDLPVKLVDSKHSIEEICAAARSECRADPSIKYIAIDYVEMISSTTAPGGGIETINQALRSLVALKKELKVPIFLVSQLRRRGGDVGRYEEPTMDELKGSGLIEQSADVMVLLWEDRMVDSERRMCSSRYRKIGAKIIQRDGATGVVHLLNYPQQSRYQAWPYKGGPIDCTASTNQQQT